MNNIDKIRNNLKTSSIFTTILSVVYSFMLISSIIIYFIFDRFKEYIKEDVSEKFYTLLNEEGSITIVLIYILIFILIIPFLANSIIQTIKSNKLANDLVKIDLDSYISIIKNTFIFIVFGFSFMIGILITYFSISIGNILFIIIPLSLTIPFYIAGFIFKLNTFKLAKKEYKKL